MPNVKHKKNREFSKSFEISLGDIDQLTERVDNGIKLKRNKEYRQEQDQEQQAKKPQFKVDMTVTQTLGNSETQTANTDIRGNFTLRILTISFVFVINSILN